MGVVYPPKATNPVIPAAPIASTKPVRELNTIPEGSNEDDSTDQ